MVAGSLVHRVAGDAIVLLVDFSTCLLEQLWFGDRYPVGF